ncbi:MAG: type VI secretion system baseplate subunit TssF [Candidatus Manganitrophaceae bacterium]|nr:MAG: type VI secretion system baseplate subunit TssF [Candidatus Manganitrophaceae bacterium]
MPFNKYYQDELTFLREMGREFARAYPAAAPFLADRGSDPDVERLLEGFAFLTGRIRQKLDDEFPELVHALMSLLWPHYLRPIPSMSIVEFTPITGAVRERQPVPRGTEVASLPVEGIPCRFRTAFDLDLYPFAMEEALVQTLPDGRSALRLRFKMGQGAILSQIRLETLRLFLHGDPAYPLYLWLCRHVSEVRVRALVQGKPSQESSLPSDRIEAGGFSEEEAILPYPKGAFDGYRYLQEYFTFPEKFLFVALTGLHPVTRTMKGEGFEIDFVFSEPPAASLHVTRENIRLFCTPVVNLLPMESDPIRVNHQRVEYPIRPAGANPIQHEIYSVDRAVGWVRGTAAEQEYPPFVSFQHHLGPTGRRATYYQPRLRGAVVGDGTDTYVSFVNGEQATVVPPTETIVFSLTCTNRALPGKLRVGDIQTPTDRSPEFARFRNITKVTPAIRPPVGGDLYWRLISHLSLNYTSLSSIEALRGILELYNFPSLYDRQAGRANERRLEGIVGMESRGADLLFRGAPVRGIVTSLSMKEDHFAGEGDLFLFATILNEFLSLYVSVNAFSRLTVRGVQQGEVYSWPPRIGRQAAL